MSDTKISALPDGGSTISIADILPIVHAGSTRRATVGQVLSQSGVVDALITYGSGTAYNDTTINSAMVAIGTTNKTALLLRPGTWTVSNNRDWSAYTNITLIVLPGAILTKSGSGAITFGGPFEAGLYQVFSGFSAGNIIFGAGSVDAVRPEWWSADIAGIILGISAAANILFIEMQAKTYTGSSLITISTARMRLVGKGQQTKIETSSTTGGILISAGSPSTAAYICLENFYLYYTGSAAYGIKADNGSAVACQGPDRLNFKNLRIEGGSGTSHGLWLKNVFEGNFEDINLPGGGGNALYLESSINNNFKRVICNPNVVESSQKWTHGIVLGYLSTSSYHSFGNTFTRCNMTLTNGNGLHLKDVVSGSSQPCNLNSFIDFTAEANGAYNVNLEHAAKNYFFNLLTSAGVSGETIIQNISYGNMFLGGQSNVTMPDPGGAQYAQGNIFIGLAGSVTISHANVYGTILLGIDSFSDSGTQTVVLQNSIGAVAGTATQQFALGQGASLSAIQGSGGSFQNLCLLPSSTHGKIMVKGKENGTVNTAVYMLLFFNASGGAVQTTVSSITAGATTAQMDFQVSGNYLQARGKHATAPAVVTYSMEYRAL